MKKIPQSITVTVRNGKNFRATRPGKTFPGNGIDFDLIQHEFPKTPVPPYRLTYSLCKKGGYRVLEDETYPWVVNKAVDMVVCFLPKSWVGLRVSRKVEKIR